MAGIDAQHFLRAVKNALAAVKKAPVPIYESLLFRIESGKLKITGANGEFQITAACDAQGLQDGAFCLSGERVRRIAASEGEVDLRVGENRVTIKTNLGRYQIATRPAADYPALETVTGVSFIFPGDMIAKVFHACADRDVRYFLNGIHVFSKNGLQVEASDGHRAAKVLAADLMVEAFDAIIPREAAKIVASLGNVGATFAPRQASFATDDLVLTTKLTDGRFPDLARVFPTYTNRFTFGRESALSALRAIVGCSGDMGGIEVQAANGSVRLMARNNDDEAESEFPISGLDGITTGVNANYLIDAINVHSDSIELSWLDPASSVALHSGNLTEVIMPMRI